jgi:hypothetical protein
MVKNVKITLLTYNSILLEFNVKNVTIGKLIKCFLKHIDWNLNVLTWKPQQTTF